MREAMVKCMEISSSSNWSLRSRILAIRAVLFCKDEPCHSFALSILRYATEPELREAALGLLGRTVDRLDGRTLALELYPSLKSDLKKTSVLRVRALALIHLTLETRANDLVAAKEAETLVVTLVSPLIGLMSAEDSVTKEAALSCILRLGVHLDLRNLLSRFLDELTMVAWKETPTNDAPVPPATQSLWNVVTELLTQ